MADDKKKDGGDAKEPAKKKKGPPAIALVAVGAALGGAGVAFLAPKQPAHAPAPRELQLEDIHHPDLMEFKFNPSTRAGTRYATISFYFVYTVREDMKDAAFAAIEANWPRAHSDVLELLMARPATDLNGSDGKAVLRRDIIDVLDAALFANGTNGTNGANGTTGTTGAGGKVARVSDVLWKDWLLQ